MKQIWLLATWQPRQYDLGTLGDWVQTGPTTTFQDLEILELILLW